jgi:hypothetical protein
MQRVVVQLHTPEAPAEPAVKEVVLDLTRDDPLEGLGFRCSDVGL